MRALQVTELTGPDGVAVNDVDEPDPSLGLVVQVEAAGIAFPDLLLSRGEYQMKPDPPFTLGAEVAGTVVRAAEDSGYEEGQRVMGFTFGGAAERAALHPSVAFPMPEAFDFDQAGGFIMNYHTSHFALHRRGRLQEGETVLVHGAAGGVGTAAVQIAKGAGARVIAVVSSDAKEDMARRAGADDVVRSDSDWLKHVRELTDGWGVDVLYDPVGGDRFKDSVRVLAPEGRLLVIGFTEGQIPSIAVNRLLLKNVSVVGVAWGSFVGDKPELTREIGEDLDRLAGEGFVDPLVGGTYALEDGAQALRDLDERRATGKLVLRPQS
jgi:NADPH2:quinone reductase